MNYDHLAKPPMQNPDYAVLTEDWLNFEIGHAYPKGTVLMRNSCDQYYPPSENNTIGCWCISCWDDIRDIAKPLTKEEAYEQNIKDT